MNEDSPTTPQDVPSNQPAKAADRLIPDKPVIERFLDRYIVVWIWSVLFGTVSGLFYSSTGISVGSWGPLTALVAIPTVLTLGAALLSFVHLYQSLTAYILPLLLHAEAAPGGEARERLAYHLRRSFIFVLWTALFRGLTEIVQVLLAAASSSRF